MAAPPLKVALPCPSKNPPESPRCEATNNVHPSGAPDADTVTVTPSLVINANAGELRIRALPGVPGVAGNGWVASQEKLPPAGTTSTLFWPPHTCAASAGEPPNATTNPAPTAVALSTRIIRCLTVMFSTPPVRADGTLF